MVEVPLAKACSRSAPTPGELVELVPHDLSPDGGSVARLDGLIVFLDQGLPGDRIRARISSCAKNFVRAEVLQVLEACPGQRDTAPPYCPELGRCGGCAWPGLAPAAEEGWKERQVRELFRRIGKLELEDNFFAPLLASPRRLAYRNKLELAFAPSAGGVLLGMKRRASHELVPVQDCALARSSLAAILACVREWLRDRAVEAWDGKGGFLRHLVVRQPEYAPQGKAQCQVELISTSPQACGLPSGIGQGLACALREQVPELTGFVHSLRLHPAPVAYGERVLYAWGQRTLHERMGKLLLEAPPTAFMQANSGAAALMYERVCSLSQNYVQADELIWDLYCGVGGLGLLAAEANRGLALHGFDSVPDSVAFARRNAVSNGLDNCVFSAGDVAQQARRAVRRGKPQLVISDPPRAGLSAASLKLLLELGPRALIALSCDLASQARDLARLVPAYRPCRAWLFDFFPHTPHIETCVLLEKN